MTSSILAKADAILAASQHALAEVRGHIAMIRLAELAKAKAAKKGE